jgi:hypothetical protein
MSTSDAWYLLVFAWGLICGLACVAGMRGA